MTNQPLDEEAIFLAALEKQSQQERNAFVEEACADHPDLLERVRELLGSHDESMGPLDAPIANINATLDQPITEKLGTQIGPYKLREWLGEGGMGVVYVAEQTEPVKRKVALKVIKPGMDTRQVIARFEAERQALAMMDHPNIARVFDGGATNSGQPYFVMELVCGVPLTGYCDEHALTTNERLQIFLKVCRAVQHAHQKGFIHRDLKPSNVLVASIDGEAVPKVIDFGVAKAVGPKLTEETVYTQISQLVGTPLYMSPEQVELGVADIDTRSDVYSLGVLLYQLLTGNTPFDSNRLKDAGFDEMRRIIREDEPPKPSAMVSTLRVEALSTASQRRGSDPRKLSESLAGELDWLVMKALEKDRNRRYESASALAADVERYLAGEPVEACPPSSVYQFKKFAARNKTVFTTAALVLIALLLGIAGTGWQAWRATRNSQRANVERAKALENFRRARDTVDKYLTTVETNALLQNPEMQPLRGELMELAREYYQQFIDDRKHDVELQADLAEAYVRTGNIAFTLGESEKGYDLHAQAVAIRERLAAANPENADLQHDLVATIVAISEQWHVQRTHTMRKAIEAGQNLVQPSHRFSVGRAYLNLGNRLIREYAVNTGDGHQRDEAIAAAKHAQEIFEQLIKEQPNDADYEEGLADAYGLVAICRDVQGNPVERQKYHDQALAIFKRLSDNHPENADYLSELAMLYGAEGKHRDAIEILGRLVDQSPNVVRYQEALGGRYRSLAIKQTNAGEFDEARLSGQAAVDIAGRLAERYPKNIDIQLALGLCHDALGMAELKAGDNLRAIESFKAAVATLTLIKPSRIGHLSDAYTNLSDAYEAAGDVDAAITSMEESMRLGSELRERFPDNLQFVAAGAHDLLRIASLLRKSDKLEEALAKCRGAAELLAEKFVDGKVPDAPMRNIFNARNVQLMCYRDIAGCLETLERYADATDAYRQAIAAEVQIVRDVPRSLVHESPNPLYDSYIAACRLSQREEGIESLLREELATWRELEQRSAFKDTCQLRQLEIQLRLAEHLLASNRPQLAAEQYSGSRSLLETLLSQKQIQAKTIKTCQHVMSRPHADGARFRGAIPDT